MPLKKNLKKTTRAKSRSYDTKYLGDEPSFDEMPPDEERETIKLVTYNWYNYFLTNKDLRDDVLAFVETHQASRLPDFQYYDDNSLKTSAAKLCRMITRGWVCTDKEMEYITNSLDSCSLSVPEEKTEEVKKPVVIRPKPNLLIQELDEVEDKWTRDEKYDDYEFYERLQAVMPTEDHRKELKEWLEGRLSEFTTHKGDYKGYNCGKIAKFLRGCLSDLDRIGSGAKKRRSRTPKAKSADKIIAKMKYMPSSKDFKLESENPEKVVGCKGIFIFNTHNRELQYYGGDHISVKGTTLIGWNESRRTTLRKPDEFLKIVLDKTKPAILKAWDGLTTKTYTENMSGRVSDKHIIVRVFS